MYIKPTKAILCIMRDRYTVTIKMAETEHAVKAKTYAELADKINEKLGCPLVSKVVITNWYCRNRKSPRYDFIEIN